MIEIWPFINTILTVGATLVSILVGFIAKNMVGALADLKRSDDQIRRELATVQQLVAGQYITRTESQHAREQIMSEFRTAVDRLETRVRAVEIRCGAHFGGPDK